MTADKQQEQEQQHEDDQKQVEKTDTTNIIQRNSFLKTSNTSLRRIMCVLVVIFT
jgi:hypothetical protein